MENLRISSAYCKSALAINKNLPYSLQERTFSCFALPSSCQKNEKPGSTRRPPNLSHLQMQQRNLSEAANEANKSIANQVPSLYFTGIWETLSQSKPVCYMQDALTTIHDYSGMPWWASIIVSTVFFRTLVTLPLAVYQYKIMARLELLALEMPAIVAELKKEAAIAMEKFNWPEKHTRYVYNRSLKKQWNALIVRDNCHPAKTVIVLWGQIPLWICQSIALRNLVYMMPDPTTLQAQIVYTEMTIGGFGWIPNLTEVDNSYILPVALCLINLGIIELQTILRNRPTTRLQIYSKNFFRVLSVAMIPIAGTVPSALCVYWVSSSGCGLAQNLLLTSPAVRRAFGIPKTKSEVENPYERIWNKMKGITEKDEQTPATESTNVTSNSEIKKSK